MFEVGKGRSRHGSGVVLTPAAWNELAPIAWRGRVANPLSYPNRRYAGFAQRRDLDSARVGAAPVFESPSVLPVPDDGSSRPPNTDGAVLAGLSQPSAPRCAVSRCGVPELDARREKIRRVPPSDGTATRTDPRPVGSRSHAGAPSVTGWKLSRSWGDEYSRRASLPFGR